MGLSQLIAHLFVMDRIPELATQIANQASATVWERTHLKLAEMRGPEMAGYIRARAAAVLAPLVEAAAAKGGNKIASQRDRLQSEAMELIVAGIRERHQQSKSRTTATRRAA